jgi:hypothetical protein
VVPLVAGQRSVREEWLEALRIFGIGKEDGLRILGRLGRTLLEEHEINYTSRSAVHLNVSLGTKAE